MERTNNKPKEKAKKGEEKKKSEMSKTKKTSEDPSKGIPDVDFKKFLGCG